MFSALLRVSRPLLLRWLVQICRFLSLRQSRIVGRLALRRGWPRMWGKLQDLYRPLVWHNPAHRFLIRRECVAGPFIKLTKPFYPVKPERLHKDDQSLQDHDQRVARDYSSDSE